MKYCKFYNKDKFQRYIKEIFLLFYFDFKKDQIMSSKQKKKLLKNVFNFIFNFLVLFVSGNSYER